MIDIQPEEYSFAQNLYCATLYAALLVTGGLANLYGRNRHHPHRLCTVLMLAGLWLYCLTDYTDGDFYHYYTLVAKWTRFEAFYPLEDIYQHLIHITGGNYLLFRIAVWTPACVLFVLTAKRLQVNLNHALFLVVACHFTTFAYARITLALAVAIYGYTIVMRPYRGRNGWRAAGLLLMALSPLLHRSMAVFLLFVLISRLIPFSRRNITLILCLLPVAAIAAQIVLSDYLTLLAGNEVLMEKAAGYATDEHEAANWKGLIQDTLCCAPFFVPLYYMARRFDFEGMRDRCAREIYLLYKLLFVIAFAAVAMLIVVKGNTVFFHRFLFMSVIPLSLVFTHMADHRLISFGRYKLVVLLGVFYMCYTYIFVLYRTM